MSCTGVAVSEVGPLIVIETVGRFAAEGMIALEGADSALSPAILLACTVKVYDVPFVSPPINVLSLFEPKLGGGTVTVAPVGTPLAMMLTV